MAARRAPRGDPPATAGTVRDVGATLGRGCDKQARGLAGHVRGAAILATVGFNPFRPQHRSIADYLMVAGAVVVCAALVLWALLG
jgi:hypothetical protein